MTLDELRAKINGIDESILKLLNERADITCDIGEYKRQKNAAVYAPAREQDVLKRLKNLNAGPISDGAVEAIYREIMSSSLALERIRHIAHLGNKGAFTYIAARDHFGSSVEYDSCRSISEIFQKVEQGECDYGVVPIENSVEGVVTHTMDLLVDSEVKICAQRLLKINHHLMVKNAECEIKRIYSNPQAFGQCRNWLLSHLPSAAEIWVASTTEAAMKVATEEGSAAIASDLSAEVNGLHIVHSNIQDIHHNMTRFLVIAKHDVPETGSDKTSIIFSIRDKVGALLAMLQPFQENNINLTKIESRPSKRKAWDYFFFVDFEGHREQESVKKALADLDQMCKFLKVLGSYPLT